jgi:hypothetical protein
VFKHLPSCGGLNPQPSITTGTNANDYICEPPAVLSFVPTGPASMVVTSEPTQYVRTYCPGCVPPSFAAGGFMADPSTIRGLTPAQIQDVLALPNVPTMITIVTVPPGSCVLVGLGAPAFGGSGGPPDYINRQAIGAFALLYAPHAGSGNAGAVAPKEQMPHMVNTMPQAPLLGS